ncbi:hypothetical protein [Chryseobacterium wangxinyae]|uniref:hypothetical protein n=1 Tax=Chryseobacterium sp. CY353 TaxID=2997334 RepID=UPI00226D54B7|nr:hypothetical protein [Chryseobacterium sp. CY353]MCY0970395.1 hypothetical protein [Chryseobacterium sp. CY353]
MAKGVKSIQGNPSPKVGEINYYEVSSFYPETHIDKENDIKWKLFVQERNGIWRELKGPQKTGKKVSFQLPEKWLGRKMLIEAYIYNPEKKIPSAIIITPVRNAIPTIDKVQLFYVDDKKGSTFSFMEKLIARAYCVNMFNKEVVFTLWEDDAKGAGHSATNRPIETLPPMKVNKNGIAVGEFMLTKALMKKAMEGETDPKQLEFYVTVEYYVHKKHATENENIKNPFPQIPKPHTTPAKSATIPKAKGSPAENKPASKKEEKSIGEKIGEIGKELWDWWETPGTIKKDKKPTQQEPEGKSPAINKNIYTEQGDGKCICKENQFYWSNKLTCKERIKVLQVCANLWGETNKVQKASELMSIMHVETAATFSPSADNGAGFSGLIQFSDDQLKV